MITLHWTRKIGKAGAGTVTAIRYAENAQSAQDQAAIWMGTHNAVRVDFGTVSVAPADLIRILSQISPGEVPTLAAMSVSRTIVRDGADGWKSVSGGVLNGN